MTIIIEIGKMAEAPPVTEKLQWFEYVFLDLQSNLFNYKINRFWDEDDSGELDQDEV